jgi:hypothetical protein
LTEHTARKKQAVIPIRQGLQNLQLKDYKGFTSKLQYLYVEMIFEIAYLARIYSHSLQLPHPDFSISLAFIG